MERRKKTWLVWWAAFALKTQLITGWKDHLLLFSHEKSVPASLSETASFQIESYWRSKEEIEKRIVRQGRWAAMIGARDFSLRSSMMNPAQIKFLSSAQYLPDELDLRSQCIPLRSGFERFDKLWEPFYQITEYLKSVILLLLENFLEWL